jgi:hypothetical protein
MFRNQGILEATTILSSTHSLAQKTLTLRSVEDRFKTLEIERRQLKPEETMLAFVVVCKELGLVTSYSIN